MWRRVEGPHHQRHHSASARSCASSQGAHSRAPGSRATETEDKHKDRDRGRRATCTCGGGETARGELRCPALGLPRTSTCPSPLPVPMCSGGARSREKPRQGTAHTLPAELASYRTQDSAVAHTLPPPSSLLPPPCVCYTVAVARPAAPPPLLALAAPLSTTLAAPSALPSLPEKEASSNSSTAAQQHSSGPSALSRLHSLNEHQSSSSPGPLSTHSRMGHGLLLAVLVIHSCRM